MPISREKVERRALKAGIKASKKRHHAVSKEELLALRIQTMPAVLRTTLFLIGVALIASAWFEWPSESNTVQGLEVLVGIFSMLFGAFGIRRTLSQTLDTLDSIELADVVVQLIAEAVSNIDL